MLFSKIICGAILAAATTAAVAVDESDAAAASYGSITLFVDGKVTNIPDSPVRNIIMRREDGRLLDIVPTECKNFDAEKLAKSKGENDPGVKFVRDAIKQNRAVLRDMFMVCFAKRDLPLKNLPLDYYSGGPESAEYMTVSSANPDMFSFGGYDYHFLGLEKKMFIIIAGHEKLINRGKK